MKVKEYAVLEECVTNGITRGWNRAHKHDEDPSEDTIKESVLDAVMLEICEYFEFFP